MSNVGVDAFAVHQAYGYRSVLHADGSNYFGTQGNIEAYNAAIKGEAVYNAGGGGCGGVFDVSTNVDLFPYNPDKSLSRGVFSRSRNSGSGSNVGYMGYGLCTGTGGTSVGVMGYGVGSTTSP